VIGHPSNRTPGPEKCTEDCRQTGQQRRVRMMLREDVYYWRTWYKAVCGGKGGSEGHVLRDTTSRGLRGRV